MVHYIRFLSTPQVSETKKKHLTISAVIAVTTDLGDALLAQDLPVIAQISEGVVLLLDKEFLWQSHSRVLRIEIGCDSKIHGRLVRLHLTTRDTHNAYLDCEIPAVVNIISAPFRIEKGSKSEETVERRFSLGGSPLTSWEQTGDSIARHIWDASLGCLTYFNTRFDDAHDQFLPLLRKLLFFDVRKRIRVLEVGAGCGMVGIALSYQRVCEVVLTDLEDAQEIMQTNIDCASPCPGSSLKRQVLGWGAGLDDLKDSKFDLVLVSDCIYNPDSSVLLVQTLKALTKRNPRVLIFVAFKRRHDADEVFFQHMRDNELEVAEQDIIQLPHFKTDYDDDLPPIELFTFKAARQS